MFDRDELIRFRIERHLDLNRARPRKMEVGLASLVVRQTTTDGLIVGAFADNKKEYRTKERSYFIESRVGGSALSRQIWLPPKNWAENSYLGGTVTQRELLETNAEPERRFAAWQEVRTNVLDPEFYDIYYDFVEPRLYADAASQLDSIDAR
jgi:hypothetical protein